MTAIGPDHPDFPPHLRDDAPEVQCSDCKRFEYAPTATNPCGMLQPDGSRCRGLWVNVDRKRVDEIGASPESLACICCIDIGRMTIYAMLRSREKLDEAADRARQACDVLRNVGREDLATLIERQLRDGYVALDLPADTVDVDIILASNVVGIGRRLIGP